MGLLAVRLIDVAIFGSLGALWIGGAIFIVLLYRWILRFERREGPTTQVGVPVLAEPDRPSRERVPTHVRRPQTATAREGFRTPQAIDLRRAARTGFITSHS